MTPESTRCEMTWIVMPSEANALGTVFGGRIMAWIDVCAAVSAGRFTRTAVVTAAMDQLLFRAPIKQGQVVVLQSRVNWAGRTSMEIGVRVDAEEPSTGQRTHASTAYPTFVSVDGDGRPLPVPTLERTSPEDVRRWGDAEVRRNRRLIAREEDRVRRQAHGERP